MAELEKLQVTVDAKIDAYKKKMNEVKNVTKASMQNVQSELGKAKGPELDISVDKSLEKVSKAVEKVKKKVDEVNKVKVGGDNMKGMQNAADQTTGKLGKVQESVKTARNAIREVIKTNPVLSKLQTVLSAVVTAGRKGFGMLATAVDKTRSAISKVSGVAQSLVQKFRAMVAPIKNAAASILHIGRNSETAAKKVGLLSGAVGKLVGLISAFAIFNFAKSCIELGSDLQEVQNVVDTVFPHMKGQMNEWAKAAAQQFGLSETMAKKYAGTFGAMAKSFGFAEDKAYEMSTKLAGLSGDIASFYNISQDEAYTKMKSVFTGETEALKELGVVMTQNALDQYALANGFGRTTQAMSEQEKVALRYAFVQDKLKNATGDFIRTQDGWANQVRMLNLQFQSLKATIGEGLINVFTPVIKVINILLSKIATVANAFKALTSLLFGKGGQASGGTIGDSTSDIASGFDNAADSAGNLADATDKAGDAAADAAKKALGLMAFDKINKLSDDAAASSGGSGSGSGGGGGGAGGITGDDVDFGEIEEEAETIGDKMAAIFDVFQQAWENKGQRVIEAWTEALNSIKTLASDVGTSFYEVFTNGTGQEFLENILELFADIADIVNAFASALDDAWKKGEAGTAWVQSLFDKWNAIMELVDAVADAFVNVWNNGTGSEILGHILSIMTNINDAVANLATRFKDAWTEGGRGEAIWQNILNIVNTVLTHVENITGYFKEWASKVDFGPLLDSFNNLLTAVNNIADVAGTKLEGFVQNVLLPIASVTIEETLPNVLNDLASALNNLASGDFKNAGMDVATAFNEIVSAIGNFTNDGDFGEAAENLASNVAEFINGAFEELDLGHVGEIVGNSIISALKGINKFLEEVDWHQIGRQIGDFLANIDWLELLGEVCEMIVKGLLAVGRIAGGIVTGFVSGLAGKLAEAVTGSEDFNISEWLSEKWDNLKVSVSLVLDKTWDTLTETYEKIKDSDAVKTIKGKVGDAWESTKTSFEAIKDSDAVKTAKATLEGKWEEAKSNWSEIKEGTHEAIKNVKAELSGKWEEAKSNWSEIKSGTYDCIKEVQAKLSGKWNDAKENWSSIKSGTYDCIKEVTAKLSGKWDTAKENWSSIKSGTYDCIKNVKAAVKGSWDTAKKNWNSIKSGTYNATKKVKATLVGNWTDAKKKWDSIKTGTHNAIKKVTMSFSAAAGDLRRWLNTNIASKINSAMNSIPLVKSLWTNFYFANGAYLPANDPVLAMVGDNRSHPEIVAPDNKLREMADRAAQNAGAKIDYAQLQRLIEAAVYAATTSANRQSGGNEVSVKIDGDPKKMFNVVVEQIRSYYRQHGQLPFPI